MYQTPCLIISKGESILNTIIGRGKDFKILITCALLFLTIHKMNSEVI